MGHVWGPSFGAVGSSANRASRIRALVARRPRAVWPKFRCQSRFVRFRPKLADFGQQRARFEPSWGECGLFCSEICPNFARNSTNSANDLCCQKYSILFKTSAKLCPASTNCCLILPSGGQRRPTLASLWPKLANVGRMGAETGLSSKISTIVGQVVGSFLGDCGARGCHSGRLSTAHGEQHFSNFRGLVFFLPFSVFLQTPPSQSMSELDRAGLQHIMAGWKLTFLRPPPMMRSRWDRWLRDRLSRARAAKEQLDVLCFQAQVGAARCVTMRV